MSQSTRESVKATGAPGTPGVIRYSAQLRNIAISLIDTEKGEQTPRKLEERPFIEVIGDHQLRDEQRNGLSSHRVQEITDNLLSK